MDKHTQGEVTVKPSPNGDALLLVDSKGVSIGGFVHISYNEELREGNAKHGAALWNAAKDMATEEAVELLKTGSAKVITHSKRIHSITKAANGMKTEEAVRYLEHGREMVSDKKWARDYLLEVIVSGRGFEAACICIEKALTQSLAKLEGK